MYICIDICIGICLHIDMDVYIYIYVCILGRGVHHGVVLPRETILKTGSVVNTCCKYIKECNRFKNIIQKYKEY